MIADATNDFNPPPDTFFFWIVLPYLLITIMAYVGARVVYTLGKAVTEARELGSYRLVERLGQGGMGEVWRAKHRLLARPAAIKLIRASGIEPTRRADDAMRRFEREAQVTAGLSSPHTVQLFDFGVADDGSFYYVMELLDGLDLESWCSDTDQCRQSGRSTCCDRSVIRSQKPSHSVWCIATSSRPISSCAGTVVNTTS